MPPSQYEFASLFQRISVVRSEAAKLEPDNELVPELAKYLCVLASGLVEAKLRDVTRKLVHQTKPRPSVGNAAIAFSKSVQNPRADRLKSFSKVFDANISKRIEALDTESTSALHSIMTNRHHVSHGSDITITLVQIGDYIDRLKPIFKELDRIGNS